MDKEIWKDIAGYEKNVSNIIKDTYGSSHNGF